MSSKLLTKFVALFGGVLAFPLPAQACMTSAGNMSIFFATRPAKLPSEVVVLKVQAPADEPVGRIDLPVLEPADGVRGASTIRVVIDAHPQDCKDYIAGSTDRPAYIFGNYQRAGDGVVFFRARWLPSELAIRRIGKPWRSYIVDPAYLKSADEKDR